MLSVIALLLSFQGSYSDCTSCCLESNCSAAWREVPGVCCGIVSLTSYCCPQGWRCQVVALQGLVEGGWTCRKPPPAKKNQTKDVDNKSPQPLTTSSPTPSTTPSPSLPTASNVTTIGRYHGCSACCIDNTCDMAFQGSAGQCCGKDGGFYYCCPLALSAQCIQGYRGWNCELHQNTPPTMKVGKDASPATALALLVLPLLAGLVCCLCFLSSCELLEGEEESVHRRKRRRRRSASDSREAGAPQWGGAHFTAPAGGWKRGSLPHSLDNTSNRSQSGRSHTHAHAKVLRERDRSLPLLRETGGEDSDSSGTMSPDEGVRSAPVLPQPAFSPQLEEQGSGEMSSVSSASVSLEDLQEQQQEDELRKFHEKRHRESHGISQPSPLRQPVPIRRPVQYLPPTESRGRSESV